MINKKPKQSKPTKEFMYAFTLGQIHSLNWLLDNASDNWRRIAKQKIIKSY